jgi:tetracycline 7-halogenase / FADH2 O2-dependent halogenase
MPAPTMTDRFDIAVIGSGFGGSLMAMIARRLGYSVVLIEQGKHPRFAIGESSTPLANLYLEQIAREYDLPRLLPLTNWGAWQRTYPNVACGLKRGFTFLRHDFGKGFARAADRHNELLVAASPHDEVADTHWFRADFDQFLVGEAQAYGVVYLDQTKLRTLSLGEEPALRGERRGAEVTIKARYVIDASGPRGFVHRTLELDETPFARFPATQALYTHFTGVKRLDELLPLSEAETPPYPMDDAAVHHVFDGGWIWVLRFNNGVTSAGVAAGSELANEINFPDREHAWQRLLARLPTVQQQFAEAVPVEQFVHARALPFRSATVVGDRWALLPSAAGFIDPLLSTGFPLTLLGIKRLGAALRHDPSSNDFQRLLREYETATLSDLDTASMLVAALYANFSDFELFSALSLLYFAAASFSETALRLGRDELAKGFLRRDDHHFATQFRCCCERAINSLNPTDRRALIAAIYDCIRPVDVAGLSCRDRRNWYPVNAKDLLDGADKLGVTRARIEDLLRESGFVPDLRRLAPN